MDSANTALTLRTGPGADETILPLQTEPRAGMEVSPGVAELLEYLKQKIRTQEQATIEAQEAAADLQLQLTAAQAEVARSRTQYHGVPKSRSALTRVETDLSEATTKLHAAKKELDFEKRSRRTEAIQASTKIQRIEQELSAAIATTNVSASKTTRVPVRLAAGIAVALALATGIAAFAMHHQTVVSASASPIAAADSPGVQDPVADLAAWQSKSSVIGRHSAPSPSLDFTQSYDRLSQALAALPGRDAEEVLRQIQKAGRGCALRWNDGEPSLLFGGQSGSAAQKPNSLPDALTKCAEAVEKLR